MRSWPMAGLRLSARVSAALTIVRRRSTLSLKALASGTVRSIPLRRHGQPEEIGHVVAFLASERASYVTGATIQVDGGVIQSTF